MTMKLVINGNSATSSANICVCDNHNINTVQGQSNHKIT